MRSLRHLYESEKGNTSSKTAVIHYENYDENVDMLNKLFKQSELDNLIKTDKDIVKVEYYENGKLVKTVKP